MQFLCQGRRLRGGLEWICRILNEIGSISLAFWPVFELLKVPWQWLGYCSLHVLRGRILLPEGHHCLFVFLSYWISSEPLIFFILLDISYTPIGTTAPDSWPLTCASRRRKDSSVSLNFLLAILRMPMRYTLATILASHIETSAEISPPSSALQRRSLR